MINNFQVELNEVIFEHTNKQITINLYIQHDKTTIVKIKDN